MKQDKATTQKYSVKQLSGECFVFNNETKDIDTAYRYHPMTRAQATAECRKLNNASPSIPVNDELDMAVVNKIVKHKWYVVREEGYFPMVVLGNQSRRGANNPTIVINDSFNKEAGTHELTADVICTAVNETYGKGYNPAAMEELYKALEALTKVHSQLHRNAHTTTEIRNAKTALNNAKNYKAMKHEPQMIGLEFKRETFQSPYTEFSQHIGKEFEILDWTPAAKRNHPDFTDTYEIRFNDGERITALPEEIFNNTGWNPTNAKTIKP